ncbi:hypothetical protein L218DRAFT_1015947 [Marasmius fiardii PR-910]|nr:hypothetical protein L218DRAFT_1015947 [Marasmius fiardii PR-910]
MEQQSRRTQPTAADDLGLSLSEADDGDDLLQDLGSPARSYSPEHTTGLSSRKPLTDQLFPKPPSTKPTVPDESAESEVEMEPSSLTPCTLLFLLDCSEEIISASPIQPIFSYPTFQSHYRIGGVITYGWMPKTLILRRQVASSQINSWGHLRCWNA